MARNVDKPSGCAINTFWWNRFDAPPPVRPHSDRYKSAGNIEPPKCDFRSDEGGNGETGCTVMYGNKFDTNLDRINHRWIMVWHLFRFLGRFGIAIRNLWRTLPYTDMRWCASKICHNRQITAAINNNATLNAHQTGVYCVYGCALCAAAAATALFCIRFRFTSNFSLRHRWMPSPAT